jgi:hypothetical protein
MRWSAARNCNTETFTVICSSGFSVRQAASWRAEHPVADGGDDAAVFGDGDELGRVDDAELGVRPAQQCFALGHAAAFHGVDRLVFQVHLAAFDGAVQVGQQPAAAAAGQLQRRVEAQRLVAAQALGLVHRHVGMREQLAGRMAVGRVDDKADAAAQLHDVAAQLDGFGQALVDARGHGFGFAALTQAGQQHDEFVAAQTGHHVGSPHTFAHPRRNLHQQRVAGRVAQ